MLINCHLLSANNGSSVFTMKKKVLITGSNGFIGSYFRKYCNKKKQDYIFGTSSKSSGADLVKFKSLYKNITSLLQNHDIYSIVHLAAIIPETFQDTNFYDHFLPNIEMMNNLSEFALKNNVKRFINISSFGSMKIPEHCDVNDYYTLSKVTGELFCQLLNTNNIKSISLRLPSVFGEYFKRKSVVNIFIKNALNGDNLVIYGNGQEKRNFIYAGDVLNIIELCLNNDITGTYAFVSEKNTSIIDLAEEILKITKSDSKIIFSGNEMNKMPDEPKYDYSKTRNYLKYTPVYSLHDGLKKYIEWIKKNEISFNF